jgi:hypothetical protein
MFGVAAFEDIGAPERPGMIVQPAIVIRSRYGSSERRSVIILVGHQLCRRRHST